MADLPDILEFVKKVEAKYKRDKNFRERVDSVVNFENEYVKSYHRGGMPEHDMDAARFGIAIALFMEDKKKAKT